MENGSAFHLSMAPPNQSPSTVPAFSPASSGGLSLSTAAQLPVTSPMCTQPQPQPWPTAHLMEHDRIDGAPALEWRPLAADVLLTYGLATECCPPQRCHTSRVRRSAPIMALPTNDWQRSDHGRRQKVAAGYPEALFSPGRHSSTWSSCCSM